MSDFKVQSGDSYVTGNFDKLENLVSELDKDHYVDIGLLGDFPILENGEINLPGIGAVHEFGSIKRNIPARSFIRMPLEVKIDDMVQDTEKVLNRLLGEGDIKGIFKVMGIAGERVIIEAFETGGFGSWPDIKPETKRRKKSSAILIDTGELWKAITSKAV